VTAIANMGSCERAAYDIPFYSVEGYSENNMGVIHILMINDHKILFISSFLYFIIVRKSIRTFTNEFSIFGGNSKLTLVAAKKCIFSFRLNWHISIYPDMEPIPHPSVC
jgi:hypothetical protein